MHEWSRTAKMNATISDQDYDRYIAGVIYAWKGGDAGVRLTYDRNATYKSWTGGSLNTLYSLQPYARAQIGPVKVQAELDYFWGDAKTEDGSSYALKLEAINFFLDAVADFNMFYFGGTFAYLSGDNPDTADKREDARWDNKSEGGGIDWNPCLIMWNFDRTYWAGRLYGYAEGINSPMQNAWFGQIRGGVRPIAALDIMASVSYAVADQKYDNWSESPTLNRTYGTEIDLTATYKITNNLYYMLGIGYLFTGDYFKGTGATNEVRDDYLVINKLTLTF
jgi:hypothetical protein